MSKGRTPAPPTAGGIRALPEECALRMSDDGDRPADDVRGDRPGERGFLRTAAHRHGRREMERAVGADRSIRNL